MPQSFTSCIGANTGRHCVQGGCGEQLDLFDEGDPNETKFSATHTVPPFCSLTPLTVSGQVSELSQFGPGIVLYFKFLKWMYWVFFVVSLLYLPMIIINVHGSEFAGAANLDLLALTTIGNLGDATNVTKLQIPGCGTYNYILENFFEDG